MNSMRTLILFTILIATIATAIYGVHSGRIHVPPEYNPWATLDIYARPNFLTHYKLARLSKDSSLCQQVLATTNIKYERLDDRMTGPACGFFNAVRIKQTSSSINAPFALSCRTAVSLAMWEHHVLAPAALKHFDQSIAKIEHFGSYSCRNIYGRENATRSQHATAEAFDIAGFVLADGQRIRVLKDWANDDAKSEFLKEVRQGACDFFDGVLSPDYNAAHRDHFHFDRGPYRICR